MKDSFVTRGFLLSQFHSPLNLWDTEASLAGDHTLESCECLALLQQPVLKAAYPFLSENPFALPGSGEGSQGDVHPA